MNPAGNETDAHAQDFMADELLLSILQALSSQCTHSLTHSLTHSHYTLLSTPDRSSLCVAAEQFVAPTNSSPAVPRTTPDTSNPPHISSRGLWAAVRKT